MTNEKMKTELLKVGFEELRQYEHLPAYAINLDSAEGKEYMLVVFGDDFKEHKIYQDDNIIKMEDLPKETLQHAKVMLAFLNS